MGEVVIFPSSSVQQAPCATYLAKLVGMLQIIAEELQSDALVLCMQAQHISLTESNTTETQTKISSHIELMQIKLEIIVKLSEATLLVCRHNIILEANMIASKM